MISLVLKHNNNVEFIDANELVGELDVDDTFPIASYSRLFLTKLTNVNKMIYLDCDSLVLGELYELWDTDLQGYMFAGVMDAVSTFYREEIGLKKTDIYVNAGVLLMNLEEMRRNNWISKVKEFIIKFNGSVPHHDQGIINGISKGKIKTVHPKFNVMDIYYKYSLDQMERMSSIKFPYTNKEYNDAINQPVFVHYTAGFYGRPWDIKCKHPKKDEYLDHVILCGYDLSSFLVDKPLNKNAMIMSSLYNLLPFSLYLLVYKLTVKRKAEKFRKRS